MNSETEKLELINWISRLKDQQLIHELHLLKEKAEKKPKVERKFGDGKYLIEYIADDFNEPINHFDEDTRL